MEYGPMKQRILVIDDEHAVGELLKILLTRNGYEVATAENGREGLRQIDILRPDLVITDITMPDMEGIELISILRKEHERLPIVAMSGNIVGRGFLKVTELLGATATLNKPFSTQELLEVVRAALPPSGSA